MVADANDHPRDTTRSVTSHHSTGTPGRLIVLRRQNQPCLSSHSSMTMAVMNTNTAQRWYEGEYQGDLVYMHYSLSSVASFNRLAARKLIAVLPVLAGASGLVIDAPFGRFSPTGNSVFLVKGKPSMAVSL
jgi:hypothetical protein